MAVRFAAICLLCISICLLAVKGSPYHVKKPDAGLECPCSDPAYCQRITDGDRREVVGYAVSLDYYKQFDWEKLTTIIVYESALQKHGMDVVCLAHKYNTRVLIATGISPAELVNATARAKRIDYFFNITEKYFMDGANIDVEILTKTEELRNGLTDYVKETKMKYAVYPNSIVVVDVWWFPNIYHDTWSLVKYSDFLFVMSYDEQADMLLPCIARANAPYYRTEFGISVFRDVLGIAGHKLVMGLPWYGYKYNCTSLTSNNMCHIKKVNGHCTEAAGVEISYQTIRTMLPHSMDGRHWGDISKSPYFNYKDVSGTISQVWYDDVESLKLKYSFAEKFDLRGVGIWSLESLNYANTSDPTTKEMWAALPSYT